jgi:hypothetical protein
VDCQCLLGDSTVIESRKEAHENVVYRCRECKTCGTMRITVEMDYLDIKTSTSLKFLQIPWRYFKLACVRRIEAEYRDSEAIAVGMG